MKVSYTPHLLDDYTSVEYDPRLWVIFKNPANGQEVAVLGLVDSGAADILIHSDIGEAMGIDVASGDKALYGGIGGIIEGYRHTLVMRVRGEKREHEVQCVFAPIASVDALFGQRGFFENYKVVFEKYKNQFEVIAKRGRGRR